MATILQIDPNEATQQLVQTALAPPHDVVAVSDGSTAIQYCAMLQPDLILVDSALADIDPADLTLRLKMFMPQTPILVSAPASPTPEQAAWPADNYDGWLAKPLTSDELREQVQALLPQPQSIVPPATLKRPLTQQAVAQFEDQIAALKQANNRLASLNAVSALIGTSLDLEHLTDQILQQIQKTVDFDSATLLLLKGSILEAAASRGFSEYGRGLNIYTKKEKNSAWRVVKNKLPLIINDVAQSDYWEERPELARVRAWLGVPLIYKDRVVGVLTLDKNEPLAFTDADARYVFTLAYQIAIAVENAQLFQEWENQATRLKLINEVAQEITTLLKVGDLFEALAQAIFERLQYDRVAILAPVDGADGLLTLRACYSRFEPALAVNGYQQQAGTGLIGRAIEAGRSLLVNDLTHSNETPPLPGLAAQAAMVIPILGSGRVEAIINIDSCQPHAFKDQDLWTVSSLASQAATVIENARLYQDVDDYSTRLERTVVARTQRLQAIKKISRVVSQGLDVDQLLTVVGREMGHIFTPQEQAEAQVKVAISLLQGQNLAVRPLYDSGSPGGEEALYPFRAQTPVGQVVEEARPRRLHNTASPTLYRPEAPAERTPDNSLMLAPLITAGKTIGVITVERRQAPTFDDSDLETLESLAFQVASAIEHARLLRKTRELAIVDERTRLARDMHDGVAQNLAYLLIQVDRCLNMVEPDSQLEQQLDQVGQLLQQNIDELRRNIFDLRPIALAGKTLFEVIENFITEFGRRWNLKTRCVIEGQPERVAPEVESSLYRILQEALANARQHAQSSQLTVTLALKDERWITLEVADDGRGFNMVHPSQGGQGRGLGLVSMRERAATVGGQLTVESAPGEGTCIFAILPISVNN